MCCVLNRLCIPGRLSTLAAETVLARGTLGLCPCLPGAASHCEVALEQGWCHTCSAQTSGQSETPGSLRQVSEALCSSSNPVTGSSRLSLFPISVSPLTKTTSSVGFPFLCESEFFSY